MLVYMLKRYRFDEWTTNWIRNWLDGCFVRVADDGPCTEAELPGHSLNQWLSTRWEDEANPGNSGASNAPKWPEGVDPRSASPHPHWRISSWGSSISLDWGYISLDLLLVIGREWAAFSSCFFYCSIVLISVEGPVTAFFCHIPPQRLFCIKFRKTNWTKNDQLGVGRNIPLSNWKTFWFLSVRGSWEWILFAVMILFLSSFFQEKYLVHTV